MQETIQIFVNGMVWGSLVAIAAISFSLIFCTAHVFHFAHGVVIVYSGFIAWYFTEELGFPLAASIVIAILVAAIVGSLMEILVYRPLRKKGAPPLIALLASLGLVYIGQSIPMFVFGGAPRVLELGAPLRWNDVFISRSDFVCIITSLALFFVLRWFLDHTRAGVAIKAIANDAQLAKTVGVNFDRFIILIYIIGSVLCAPAGVFMMLDVGIMPYAGIEIVIMATIAVIIGGMGSIPGAFLGSFFMGLVRAYAGWILPSLWQEAILFVVLLLFITFRPRGFFGKKVWKYEV